MGLYDRQEKIKLDNLQSITVVGCGGIGYWVSKFAAMSGIEKICLYDPDVYEQHNLNRIDAPVSIVGKNKADIATFSINAIRPECIVYSFPFKYSVTTSMDTDWVVDCTDNFDSQVKNQKISLGIGAKYCKSGYDGTHISINNSVATWGNAPDGYQVTPSWVVPAVIIASLTVGKILKYNDMEMSGDVKDMYVNL